MIHLEDLGQGVWHIQFRNQAKRNALNEAAYVALTETLLQIQAKPDARVLLLSGEGPTFCAGNDRAEFATKWPQPKHGAVYRFLATLHGLRLPIVAAVQGGAVGIGATLLLHCDLVVAAPDAFLQYPFVDLGIVLEAGSSHLLPLLMGYTRAMDILLTARRVAAPEALTLGLISRVSAAPAPFDEALAAAQVIAGKSRESVQATKQLMRRSLAAVLPARFEDEIETINELLRTRR